MKPFINGGLLCFIVVHHLRYMACVLADTHSVGTNSQQWGHAGLAQAVQLVCCDPDINQMKSHRCVSVCVHQEKKEGVRIKHDYP